MSTTIKATAYHEAGHAVTALQLGTGLRRKGISIISDGLVAGWVHTGKGSRGNPSVGFSDRTQLRMERAVMVTVAGIEAQRVYKASSIRSHHDSADRRDIGDLLTRLCGSNSEEFKALHKLLLVRVRGPIRSPYAWAKITEVAEALLSAGVLSKEETVRI